MPYYKDTYTVIRKRLADWLQVAGGNVSDLPLDLLNRAQDWLIGYKPWDDLISYQTLTLSNGTATLPSDFARLVGVSYDSNGDSKEDWWFYKDSDLDSGYRLLSSFSKDTGHSWQLEFYVSPTYNPVVKYVKRLDDFTGSGTEYSFFPAELLLRTAQMLHIEETGLQGGEVAIIIDSQRKLLRDYEQAHHNVNNDLRMEVNDDLGNHVFTDGYSLIGDTNRSYYKYRNITDRSQDI